MDGATDAGSMTRRRLLVGLFLVTGAVAGLLGWNSTTVQYESYGAVLVIPAGAGSPVPGDNPFYRLPDTGQAANVLAVIALSSEGRAVVEKAGANPEFKVNRVAGTTNGNSVLSAQITLAVRAPDPWAARAAAMALIDLMRDRLKSLQRDAGVRESSFADFRVPVEPQRGTPVESNSARAAMGFVVAAILGLALVVVLGEARRDAVARRRNLAATTESVGEQAAPPVRSRVMS